MRKLVFNKDSHKVFDLFNDLYPGSVVCCELFISSIVTESGTELGVPYFWAVQTSETMVYGRDIHSFYDCLYMLSSRNVAVIYSFSLHDMYHFLRNKFDVTNMFKSSKQDILNFEICTDNGRLEFRSLSSISGAGTIEMFADIDPQWNRHSLTPKSTLSDREIYRFQKILASEESFISILSVDYGSVSKIPNSLSAIVKNSIVDSCGVADKSRRKFYIRKLGSLYGKNTMEIPSLANLFYLNHMFQGGYIGFNDSYVGKVCEDVVCYDFTSSYPARLAAYKYPVSCIDRVDMRGKDVNIDKLISTNEYVYTFRIELRGVVSTSCCRPIKFDVHDKGCLDRTMRSIVDFSSDLKQDSSHGVISASYLLIDICSVDWEYIREFYQFTSIAIQFVEIYLADYLPTEYVSSMLKLFVDKSINKGNPNKFVEDMAKKKVNITWGLMGAGFYRSNYNSDKGFQKTDLEYILYQYNNMLGPFRNRTSCYQWAIFCTAYARRDLLGLVKRLGGDWLYSDSDAAYFFYKEEYIDIINKYNEWIKRKLLESPHVSGDSDISVGSKYVDKVYNLGEFTLDGKYRRFKYLKLKTYLGESTSGEYKLRMSGCSNFNYSFFYKVSDPMEWFSGGSYIPAEYCDFYSRYREFGRFSGIVDDRYDIPCELLLDGGCVRFPKDFNIAVTDDITTEDFIDMVLGG